MRVFDVTWIDSLLGSWEASWKETASFGLFCPKDSLTFLDAIFQSILI